MCVWGGGGSGAERIDKNTKIHKCIPSKKCRVMPKYHKICKGVGMLDMNQPLAALWQCFAII